MLAAYLDGRPLAVDALDAAVLALPGGVRGGRSQSLLPVFVVAVVTVVAVVAVAEVAV